MICPVCSKEFVPKRNGRGGTITCSILCGHLHNTKFHIRSCPCGKQFKPRHELQKYCSHSCARSYGSPTRLGTGKPSESRECLGCGKIILGGPNIYCDNICQSIRSKKIKFGRIESSGSGRGFSARFVKSYLRETSGTVCSICKNTTWNGEEIPLVMDHVDGNPENWNLSNLRLVCGNCDMQLPTYKGKNRGSGRHCRRQRYKDGKSY